MYKVLITDPISPSGLNLLKESNIEVIDIPNPSKKDLYKVISNVQGWIVRSGTNISAQDIDEKTFSSYLDTAGIPDPDLIIRTGGEMRLSNFLIWQSAYSEYYSTTKFWPDFKKSDLRKALDTYKRRDRRFGEITTG